MKCISFSCSFCHTKELKTAANTWQYQCRMWYVYLILSHPVSVFHPSIHFLYLLYPHWGHRGLLEPTQKGEGAGSALNRSPTHRGAKTKTDSVTLTPMADSEWSFHLTFGFFGVWGKLERLEKTHTCTGRTCKTPNPEPSSISCFYFLFYLHRWKIPHFILYKDCTYLFNSTWFWSFHEAFV